MARSRRERTKYQEIERALNEIRRPAHNKCSIPR
jgi:hypothetical protein